MTILSCASFLGASAISENVSLQLTALSATDGLEIEEPVALSFSSLDSLKRAMAQPMPIDEAVIEKAVSKLGQVVGHSTYPSQLARLVFELALFTL